MGRGSSPPKRSKKRRKKDAEPGPGKAGNGKAHSKKRKQDSPTNVTAKPAKKVRECFPLLPLHLPRAGV